MAIAVASSGSIAEISATETSNPVWNIPISTGSGNDRLLLVFLHCADGSAVSHTSSTYNSTTANLFNTYQIDGGVASSTFVLYLNDSELPGSAGTYSFDSSVSLACDITQAVWYELTGVDQTTPLAGSQIATQTDQPDGTAISVTLTGASGEWGFNLLGTADNANTSGSTHTAPAALDSTTTVDDNFSTNRGASLAVGYDSVVASASQAYQWAPGLNAGAVTDSIVNGTFYVNAAAGGPSFSPFLAVKSTQIAI